MNDMVPFSFEGSSVRVVTRDGEPWFVAKDVANLLEYSNPLEAVRYHCKGVSNFLIPSAGGPQATLIIQERDVYRLIMRSKLPAAERFEEWVVGTVLPSIRKHGGYIAGQETMTELELVSKALLITHRISEEQKAHIAQQATHIEALEPVAAIAHETFNMGRMPKVHEFCRRFDGGPMMSGLRQAIDAPRDPA